MREYKALTQQTYKNGEFEIVPIRHEDRFDIMKWRNEQIYHLRQSELLTIEKQDTYFENTIAPLFNQEKPNQLLFSFLQANECIGYGGLVHINWIDRNAEVSFIMNTQLEETSFSKNWSMFLNCLEQLAFGELEFHKIFTFAFDLRPYLYPVLEGNGFKREAVLKDHCLIEKVYKDVVIHSLLNKDIQLRKVQSFDVDITYAWAKNKTIRQYSLNKSVITKEQHSKWFNSKWIDPDCLYFIAEKRNEPIGSFRLDIDSEGSGHISYLIDSKYHGNGYGSELLRLGVHIAKENSKIKNIKGEVMIENQASVKVFQNLGFSIIDSSRNLIKFKLTTE